MSGHAFCTRCGSPRGQAAAFCTSCGASFGDAASGAPTSAGSGSASATPTTPVAPASTAPATAVSTTAASTGAASAAGAGGLTFVAKLAIGAAGLLVAGGGAYVATNAAADQNNRAAPTVASAPSGTAPTSGPAGSAAPVGVPDLTITGPPAVPYGEPAVYQVTVTNTTSMGIKLFGPIANFNGVSNRNFALGEDLGFQALTWSPSGRETVLGAGRSLDQGASFTWTATFADTRLIDDGMDEYSIDFWFDGVPYDDDGIWLDDAYFFELEESLRVSIVTPVRSLDTYWLEYCDLMKRRYDTFQADNEMYHDRLECLSGRLEGDPGCPDVYLSPEYLADEQALGAAYDQLEEQRLAFIAEHFTDDSGDVKYADMYACDCFCPYTEEITCTTIPWGTKADVPVVEE